MTHTLIHRYAAALQTLERVGQEHVLALYDKLDLVSREQLLDQIDSIDWPELGRLIETHVKKKPEFTLPKNLEPAPWYPYRPDNEERAEKYAQAKALGEELVRAGKVGAFTVAGGQGTRLGWDAPKGTFPATPIRQLSLFGCFAEYLENVQKRFHVVIPWYIMTSPANDQATRDFLERNDYFGFEKKDVMIFPQGMMPAVDKRSGKVLLEAPDSLALSPNGHGGSLKALYTSGAIADMAERGIEQISYIQVDNPIVRVIDPLFIGLHALDEAQMSSKMLPKREPLEKLGNFCTVFGKMTVIEYSDLPEELAMQRLPNGELRFRAGSIAIHVIRRDFVEKLNMSSEGFGLPFHRAEKKVPYFDVEREAQIQPQQPNAVKLETFVFDALPMCDSSIIYETDRVEEFAPIKNAEGSDSPQTSKAIQTERAARWLEQNGVVVPRDREGLVEAVIEIKQTTAIWPEDLGQIELPERVARGGELLL
jgi:UDP-N-acetylglucosamine/UDP-N-acetylgalactosamine diphosphorylase